MASEKNYDLIDIDKYDFRDEGFAKEFVDDIIDIASDARASDIHIEPCEALTKIRIRIDGSLIKLCELPFSCHAPLVACIKVSSNMDITEKRFPQDGHMRKVFLNSKIDMRVSTLPSIWGEKLVIRLLKNNADFDDISKLGFDALQTEILAKAAKAQNGLILLAGPTGSGKTTTLYSLLKIINKPDVNIVTIEDPVEYTIEGLTQVQIDEKSNITFGKTLRSILRQDPDKIMVGEIRDSETAELAVRAAMTGHLVLSSIHTNNAISAIERLHDLGVPRYLIASTLLCVVAQRLVKRLCPKCKSLVIDSPDKTVYKAVGCDRCHNTGYLGRVAVAEIMTVDDRVREMIYNGDSSDKIKSYLIKNGMELLRDSVNKKVFAGVTTESEMENADSFI